MAEIVAKHLGFPEGPVLLPDGRVAFCEQTKSRVSVFDGSSVEPLADTAGSPNGAALGGDGNLYLAQNGGVVGDWNAEVMIVPGIQRAGLNGAVEDLRNEVGGTPLVAPNDICFGPDGRLYFTDPAHGYDPANRAADGIICAIDSHGGQVVANRGPVYTNGLGFMPDGRLVWVESYERHVCVIENGKVRTLCQLPENHLPDGFAVAGDGRIFIATFLSHGITMIGPDGEYLGLIELDGNALPTNCAFDGDTLYVTDVSGYPGDWHEGRLWRVQTNAKGMTMHAGVIS